jgi:hypothetical protein
MSGSSSDPLGMRSDDPVQRWRDDAERQEKEFAQARREREQARQRAAEAAVAREAESMRAHFEVRLAALEQVNHALSADLEEFARAAREAIEALGDQCADLSREHGDEIRELKIEIARLGSTMAELGQRRTASGFQFANERKDPDPVGLPNPLSDAA